MDAHVHIFIPYVVCLRIVKDHNFEEVIGRNHKMHFVGTWLSNLSFLTSTYSLIVGVSFLTYFSFLF